MHEFEFPPVRRSPPRLMLAILAGLVLAAEVCSAAGSVARHLKMLKDVDSEARLTAVRMLGLRRENILKVVPALIETLDDSDPMVAEAAAVGLRSLLGRPDMPSSRSAWEEYWRKARERYESGEGEEPQDRIKKERAALENDRGYLHLGRGEFRRAELFFLKAVSLDPKNPMYWNNLGKCYAEQGRLRDAVDRFRRALEEDPAYALAHRNLADAFAQLSFRGENRLYEALGHVEKALAMDRQKRDWVARWVNARILFLIALAEPSLAVRSRIYRKASQMIEEAVRLAPRAAQVHKTAALIFYGQERYYSAYQEVKKVYDLGYEMDRGFLAKLEHVLRKEALKRGITPPEMPKPKSEEGEGKDRVPPALRTEP